LPPPAKLDTIQVGSTSEIIAEALKLPVGSWFRGSALRAKNLQPSLYRHPTANTTDDFESLERRLIDWFKERSMPHVAQQPGTEWEVLFLMQHYGFPTRLLDFSESPLAAAYFAVTDAKKAGAEGAIWVLEPVTWNRAAFGRTLVNPVPSISSPDLQGHLPITMVGSTGRIQQQYPVAMRGIHNSRRIVVQQGVFVIYGSSTSPMEVLHAEDRFSADSLRQMSIPIAKLADVSQELTRLGYTESSMFPGLETLASLAKTIMGYA
jgi:hypothetical protein